MTTREGKRDHPPLICVPIIEARAGDFLDAIDEAQGSGDAIELRFDHVEETELDALIETLPARLARVSRPLIFTFRPREQGGARDLDHCDRLSFWRNLPPALLARAAWIDLELDLVEALREAPPAPWERVICSHHDFAGTPDRLADLYERLARTPAGAVKIATLARRVTDCLSHFDVLARARAEGRLVIALAMGICGVPVRVLAPAHGALLTFGALRPGAESASGQPTVAELRDRYRIHELTRESEIYGVLGRPVGHSRSPAIHNAAFAASGRDAVYLPFEVEDPGAFIREMAHPATRRVDWRMRGLSVTIPHKLAIIPHLDRIDALAARVGAVNTVVVRGASLEGYNTDVAGAMLPLEARMELRGTSVAVLGAGGAARAVVCGLSERGARVRVYARREAQARALADEFGVEAGELDSFEGAAEVVINCTPLGMTGKAEGRSPVPASRLGRVGLVYDLIYTPEETPLLREARAAGCQTLGGLEMLIAQAAEQFRLWTGSEAPLEVMRAAARAG